MDLNGHRATTVVYSTANVNAQPVFQYASDQSLMVYLGDAISIETHRHVLRLTRLLESKPIRGVRNLHPAYCSLLVVFDPVELDHQTLTQMLDDYVDQSASAVLPEPRTVEIPVCYGGEFGPDLAGVAELHHMAEERVIELHSSARYVVYFLGFSPGFSYLGGLPEALATPRLDVPRKRVPAGSVAIGGSHTGIYPCETPGGWRLIGKTPVAMFDAGREPMSRLEMGDIVSFRPITQSEFAALEMPCA